MPSYQQDERLMQLTSPLGTDALLIEHLTGFEGVSELFCYQVDLLQPGVSTGDSNPIDPSQILAKNVTVSIQATSDGTMRYINGIVSTLEGTGSDLEFVSYRMTIVPSLWVATLNKNTRVFQDKTVVEVIKAVLQPYGISPTDDTSNTYEQMEYCTQYRETDFNFISRLMEQHGIFYYFTHSQNDHKMVLQDTSTSLSDCPIQNKFRYETEAQKQVSNYVYLIDEFALRSTLTSGKFTSWDHSFVQNKTTTSTNSVTAKSGGPIAPAANEIYDYAGGVFAYSKTNPVIEGSNPQSLQDFLLNVELDSTTAASTLVDGSSNAIPMQTGYTFTLDTDQLPFFTSGDLGNKFVLLHIDHSVEQSPPYRSRNEGLDAKPYTNRFRAIRSDIPYRSPIVTEKPVVYGMHTGLVVVAQGEESHMDKYGRCNVQFWWDRERKANTPDNTWLRVAQSWAGKGWGTYYWPRIGDEVLISFMEGDPDQPIVVGSVYNGVNMPKYDPVGQYTISGILTRSSKNGGAANANELRFEDLKGSEQVFMNAEKDYVLHVENNWYSEVDAEQHITVKKNRFDEVDGDSHLTIKGKHLEQITGDAHLTIQGKNVVSITGDREHTMSGNLKESVSQASNISVGMSLNEQVGQNYSLTVGQNMVIQAGMKLDIIAPLGISLNCGPNTIVMGPSGIGINSEGGYVSVGPSGVTISGVLVNINSAPNPVMGSPGSAQSPQSPSSPTAPTAPTYPGDNPTSSSTTSSGGSAGPAAKLTEGTGSPASGSSPAAGGASPGAGGAAAGAAGAAAGAAGQVANQAQQEAQQAVNQVQQAAQQAEQQVQQAANQAAAAAQQAANQAQQAVQQAQQQATAAVNQVTDQARQAYQQANQAVQQAQQAVNQAAGQAKQQAQAALNQAEQQAQQCAQQASQAVNQAQQAGQQAVQQAQQAAQQAQQQAQQAAQQATQAAQQAQQQATQAVNQAKQQAQQAVQQGQQAVNQVQQQAQQAANQAKQQVQQAAQQGQQAAQQAQQQAQQAAQQAQQAAQGAQQQVQQASQQASQAAQQAAQGAQQAAQQATNSIPKGF